MMKDKLFFLVWFLLVSIPLSILMAQHNLAFQVNHKAFFVDSFLMKNPKTDYFIVHILGANCGCSKRVSSYLLERGAIAGVQEKLILVEGRFENESEILKMGIEIEHLTPEDLKTKYGIESAPQLHILDKSGRPLYAGGYKKYEEEIYRDHEILEALKKGHAVKPYPVFGCAFGKKLQNATDPLKFKYTLKD